MEKVTPFVALLIAVSIASERLVEIIKGFSPFLNRENSDENVEGRRKAYLQILAIVSGIVTSFIAGSVITDVIEGLFKDIIPHALTLLAVGLLASGGSGLWNSVLTYLLKIKDIKEVKADKAKKTEKAEIALATIRAEEAASLRDIKIEKARIELENTREPLGASVSNGSPGEAASPVSG